MRHIKLVISEELFNKAEKKKREMAKKKNKKISWEALFEELIK
jgi:hypothetical protein